MARVFVRLKLSLLASRFRGGWQQAVGIVVSAAVMLPIAIAAGVGLAVLGSRLPDVARPVVVVVHCVLALGWVVVPPLTFGLDETLDPSRLRLLPLTRRQMVSGLLAAAAIGVAPLATLIVLLGASVGLARSPAGAAVAGLAALVQFLVCLVMARAVTTALSARLRSRRGRDLLAVLAAMSGFVFAGLGQLPRLLAERAESTEELLLALERLAGVLSILPPGWAARAAVAGSQGRVLVGLGWLAASATLVAALASWWYVALARSSTTVERSDDAPDRDLFGRLGLVLPRTRIGAAVAKDLRYAWRVPQQRVQWFTTAGFAVVLPVVAAFVAEIREPELVLAAAAIAALAGLSAVNLFAADRGAVWLLVTAPGAVRAGLVAKQAAHALIVLPIVSGSAVALAVVTGGWAYLPAAIAAGAALLTVSLGVGTVASVLAPAPLPESPTNMWAGAAGTGCATVLVQLAGVLAEGLVLAPLVLGVALVGVFRPGLLPVAVGVALLVGVAVDLVGLRVALARLERQGPEFVTALAPKRA